MDADGRGSSVPPLPNEKARTMRQHDFEMQIKCHLTDLMPLVGAIDFLMLYTCSIFFIF